MGYRSARWRGLNHDSGDGTEIATALHLALCEKASL
jgi:hypothetical protein